MHLDPVCNNDDVWPLQLVLIRLSSATSRLHLVSPIACRGSDSQLTTHIKKGKAAPISHSRTIVGYARTLQLLVYNGCCEFEYRIV